MYKGSQPNVFEYYEDDGNTLNYQRNEFCKRTVTYNPALKQVVFSAQSGSYASTFKVIKCILHGFGSDLRQVNINNRPFTTNLETIRLIDGLKYLEGIYDPAYFMNLRQSEMAGKQLSFSFANTEQEIEINW